MDIHKLVVMANSIGAFFASMPDAHEARLGIAQHLEKFWAPRMRETFLGALDDETTATLHPLVRAAVIEHRASLERKKAAV